ncbi:CALM [Mytilus edulis]|uniref:CALM n=1 Tax=Mytilus edulis TaxID=6550 RepID=A0A8S3QZM3_MYTED|nr:CALM [Mytilus edulis]
MGCEMINRRQKLLEEKQYFVQQIIDSVQQQQELKTEINDLEGEQDRVFSEADSMVTDLGKTQQQNSTSAVLESIEKENLLLKKKNLELQEQLIILEKSVNTLTEEKNIYSSNGSDLEQIQQFEAIKSDLESEKEALEMVLMDLRSQLKEKEEDLEEVKAKLMKLESDYQFLKQQKVYGDGTISVSEIRNVMRNIGQNPTEADVEAILTQYDGDGNGKLDFDEFLGMIVDKLNNPETELMNAFKLFDKDKNGFVSVDELRYIVTHLGDKMTDDEVQEMFDEADLNNDGQLNYEEFVVLMAS